MSICTTDCCLPRCLSDMETCFFPGDGCETAYMTACLISYSQFPPGSPAVWGSTEQSCKMAARISSKSGFKSSLLGPSSVCQDVSVMLQHTTVSVLIIDWKMFLTPSFVPPPCFALRFAVIASGCASCPRLVCRREGCGAEFCYHCKQAWHPNQTCDSARQQRAQSLHTHSGHSPSYTQEQGPGEFPRTQTLRLRPQAKLVVLLMWRISTSADTDGAHQQHFLFETMIFTPF